MTDGFWALDPTVTYLNHGSFGACPRPVLAVQQELRARMEAEPVRFLAGELLPRLDEARAALAAFVGAHPDGLAFVPNATTGVGAVLRSLRLEPGDELLLTDHGYNACRNAAVAVAAGTGARVVTARLPFPTRGADELTESLLAAVTPRTRLALLDHVTSPTALVLPVERLVPALAARGVDTLVDGAHAPGMVPLALDALGAAYYTGNCHKWLCAPKGAGFLHVRADRREGLRPPVVSHGANARRRDRSRFHLEFDWTGTADPTPWLCVPAALRALEGLLPGGWPALRARNAALARTARDTLCRALGTPPPAPDRLLGAMAAVPLPTAAGPEPDPRLPFDPLQEELFARFRIEVPVIPWPAWPRRLLRVSAQAYNSPAQYEALATALGSVLAA